ncbi:MAG: bifunctional phosphopantothenoylcysteine decarboxylase/phosphopantothenate--cysteine ligase CoaBC [Anaerolineales bacterium]|nr:bifunctional phosphopantothenoylcysteine decarboxylase/phosphopantothenate--cysteine ligase CoaBC [Anaerolineales bacterium]
MSSPLEGKTILLGITGSIACYKAADLASRLTKAGANVDVVLTESATRFIAPITFQSVTGRPAYVDKDLWESKGHVLHIGLGRAADLIVIAPLSANTMAKLTHGIADNLLTVSILASECPLLIAPAMDAGMFSQPATQQNLEVLASRGAVVVGPESGHLASGLEDKGRMTEPADLFEQITLILSKDGPLKGKKVLVTAGPTREAIDPVRFISNRSSGKQGYAIARKARDLGADVTLISGPVGLSLVAGITTLLVKSAKEMLDAVLKASNDADVLIMAAAVADFTPVKVADQKIKKEAESTSLELGRTTDILMTLVESRKESGFPKVVVGFAAESQSLLENARRKLTEKNLDMIVANDISAADAGFGVENNRVIFLSSDGKVDELPLMSKDQVAEKLLEKVLPLI